jgi:hypothetical protein
MPCVFVVTITYRFSQSPWGGAILKRTTKKTPDGTTTFSPGDPSEGGPIITKRLRAELDCGTNDTLVIPGRFGTVTIGLICGNCMASAPPPIGDPFDY